MRRTILELAERRGPTRSICPSEAARALGGEEWRGLMDAARAAARQLARDGRVAITQRGDVLDADADWHGPIRIRVVE